jgi:glycosyltransferase involved in cell wall biosynthesis
MGHAGIDVESGIGYPTTFLPYRIYESAAWMHRDQGKNGREGNNYEWIIPNYFVKEDWPAGTGEGDYVLFMGRIGESKGCSTVLELAKRLPHLEFILCGQGDPNPYLESPNIRFHPPVQGKERGPLMANARIVLMPSNFVEPFGGVAVEAMMCGTPVATVNYGAFLETVQQGITGWRCRVLNEWIRAIELAPDLNRNLIRQCALADYSLEAVGPMYDKAFRQIQGLYTGSDWYTHPSSF